MFASVPALKLTTMLCTNWQSQQREAEQWPGHWRQLLINPEVVFLWIKAETCWQCGQRVYPAAYKQRTLFIRAFKLTLFISNKSSQF